MQYVKSGVSLIYQGLGAYPASQFTTTSPHKTTSMSAPSVLPALCCFSTHRQTLVSIHTLIHPRPQKKHQTTLHELAQPIKRVQTTRHYLSGFYYSVGERQVDNRKMPMYCSQITNRCSCRSGESTRIQLWII